MEIEKKYRKFFQIAILLFSFFSFSQTTYYVSKSGSNTNNGTSTGTPFLTISHAISQISAGDIIYIRAGTYHENIQIDNVDATSGSETLIQNYNNEQVIIDGTIGITNTWADDTIGGVQVKKAQSFTQSVTQLFVGNNQMVMARWPNAQFSDLSIYDHDNWAEGEETGSNDGSFLIDETYENPGSLSLTNSIGILNVGSFRTFNRRINSHTQQAGDDIITYTTPIGNGSIGGGLTNNGEIKDKHHYFFFEGKKEFIDADNEWFLDTTNDVLYLKPASGVNLSNTPIRGKVRDYSITITGSEHLKIKGLTFFATTIHASGSNNLEITECNFYYPSHSKRMLGDLNGANVTTFGTGSGNTARVDSSTVSGCLFINTEGEALVVRGNNNTIKNSYFRNIDWSATELNGLMVTVYIDGTSNTFTENEIYHTGASATVWPGEQSIFSYNIVSSTGHAQSDGSVFQGTKNLVFGSNVHHNFVHDTEKYAFRYDAPGGDAAQAGSFGVMHHNIADNTLGLMIKGNNQIIAHNTVINTIKNRNDIIILTEDCSNTNTWLYNNVAERIGSHRSATSFNLPDYGPMPMGTEGYIDTGSSNSPNWEVCDSGDGSLYSGTGTGNSTSNIDGLNVSRPGISYNANVENSLNYNPGNGKTVADYQPISNSLIDSGATLTNTVSRSLSTSSTLNLIVPHTSQGSASDIGAIEGTSLWTPGVRGWTPNQTINLSSLFAEPTASLTSTDADNVLNNTSTVTITAAFDQQMSPIPTITISGASVTNQTMTQVSGTNTYNYTWSPSVSDGTYTTTVSGTSSNGVSYIAGTQSITFTVNSTIPDTTGPSLTSFTHSSTVDISSGAVTITFLITATDSSVISNVSSAPFLYSTPGGPSITSGSETFSNWSYVSSSNVDWLPSQISGLAAWIDISDASSLNLSGNNINYVTDKAGNFGNLTDVGSSEPVINKNGNHLDGKDIAYFNGNNAFKSPDYKTVVSSGNHWAMGIFQVTGSDHTQNSIWSFEKSGGGGRSYAISAGSGNRFEGEIDLDALSSNRISSTAGNKIDFNAASSVLPGVSSSHYEDSWRIFSVVFNKTGNQIFAEVDGYAATTVVNDYDNSLDSSLRLALMRNRGNDDPKGYMAEFITVAGLPGTGGTDNSLIKKAEGYLAHKWGLQGNLANSHPYKSAKPVNNFTATYSATLYLDPTKVPDGTYKINLSHGGFVDTSSNSNVAGLPSGYGDFTIRVINDSSTPTVTLSTNDSDNRIKPGDNITVTATFNENMASSPRMTIGSAVNNVALTATNSTTWTYTWSTSGVAEGSYTVTVTGADLAGNSYTGTDTLKIALDSSNPEVLLVSNITSPTIQTSDVVSISAYFSEALSTTPTLSISGLLTDQAMSKFSNTSVSQIGQLIDDGAGGKLGWTSDISDSGNRIIVGGPYGSSSSFARVYQWNGKQWEQLGNEIAGTSSNDLGRPVGISGDGSVIVVGERGNTNNNFIYKIYTLSGSTWALRETLNDNNAGTLNATENGSVDFSYDGSIIALSHGLHDNGKGRARTFEWNGSNYIQMGSDILGPPNNPNTAWLGSGYNGISLTKNGKRIVVGLRGYGNNNGMVRVYDWGGSAWTQVGTDITDPASTGHSFGTSVSISNDGQTIIAGAPVFESSSIGRVHIFSYQLISGTASWTYKASIAGSTNGDNFGYSSSINGNGDKIIVGAYNANSTAGYARLYKWDGTTASQIGSNIVGTAGDALGAHVELSANGIAVIGAPLSDSGGSNSGQVKVIGTDRYEYSWNVDSPSAPSNGNYIATIAAIDKVDNVYSGSESITFTIGDPFTLAITSDDSDNVITSGQVTLTATFSENMTASPTISISGVVTNVAMTQSATAAVWTYYWQVPSNISSGTTLNVTATATSTNNIAYSGNASLTLTISPTFYLASNGVTIKCSGCSAGDTGMVSGTVYTAADNLSLIHI